MTKEEMLEQLKHDRDLCNFNPSTGESEPIDEDCRKSAKALDMAIKALEQQPCEDAISRNMAIDKLKEHYWDKELQSAKDDPCIIDAMTDLDIRIIKALPSVTPKTDVLDKIRAEIEKLPTRTRTNWNGCCPDIDYPEIEYVDVTKKKLLGIIDKYKAESEDKE